jgi:hypothetical protein
MAAPCGVFAFFSGSVAFLVEWTRNSVVVAKDRKAFFGEKVDGD